MKKSKKIIYSLSSGILLSLAWPSIGSLYPILFIALVPLLLLEREVAERQIQGSKEKLFPYIYLAIFTFNTLTTWWVWNASPFGAIAAIILNTLFLSVAIQLAHFTRKKIGDFRGDLALVFFWIAWEYFHLDWDLSWTWLTLGNGFANAPSLIQWYEYTGVFGGSLWILTSNILVTQWIVKAERIESKFYKLPGVIYGIKWVFVILLPIIISWRIYSNYEEKIDPIEIVAVQPNIDPYNEKFGGLSSEKQVNKMFALAESKVTTSIDFVIFPETSIPSAFDEDIFEETAEYQVINAFCQKHPETYVVIGASTFVVFGPNEKISKTARTSNSGIRYDVCNTAIGISADSPAEFYHKSKLVPGVEKMPFPAFFNHFQEIAFNLGGSVGSQGSQDFRSVFDSPSGTEVGPIICYESVYGEFVGEYVKNGAELLFIITNDGWWGDTPGYKQHALYGQLRAIEHRRSIARSANTGISCFINQLGETSQQTNWWEEAVISGTLNRNNQLTFYSLYGDIIGRVALGFGALLLIFAISRGFMKKE